MVTQTPNPTLPQLLAQANQALQAGNAPRADQLLTPLLERFPADPRLLHLAGTLRMHQQRYADAAALFARARAADPRAAVLAFSMARPCSGSNSMMQR